MLYLKLLTIANELYDGEVCGGTGAEAIKVPLNDLSDKEINNGAKLTAENLFFTEAPLSQQFSHI